MPLQGEGQYDIKYRYDLRQAGNGGIACNWGNQNVPMEKPQNRANPFTGFSDLYQSLDYNWAANAGNGIYRNGDDTACTLSELVTGSVVHDGLGFGDSKDAFNLASGKSKIGLAETTAAVPLYTHRWNTSYPGGNPSFGSYENRTIWLNGLSIEIQQENVVLSGVPGASSATDGVMKVRIRWDDTLINKSTRWTGRMVLEADAQDPLARQAVATLDTGKTLCIDRGISATRIYTDGTGFFTEPTVLTITNGAKFEIKTTATANVMQKSTLAFQPGAQFVSAINATLKVDPLGSCTVPHTQVQCPDCWATLPWPVTFSSVDTFKVITMTLCTLAPTPQTYHYHLQGRPAFGAPTIDGPTSFVYQAASPIVIPANSCIGVPIRIDRPVGMTIPGRIAWYDLKMVNMVTSNTYTVGSSVNNCCTTPGDNASPVGRWPSRWPTKRVSTQKRIGAARKVTPITCTQFLDW